MKRSSFVLSTSFALLTSASMFATKASAMPTLYPVDPTRLSSIINKTNSNIVADTDDANVFWVLPPQSAESRVTNFVPLSANLGFCSTLALQQDLVKQNTKLYGELDEKVAQAATKLEEMEKKLQALQDKAAQIAVDAEGQHYLDMNARLTQIDDRLKVVQELLVTCSENCEALNDDSTSLIQERERLTKEIKDYRKAHAPALAKLHPALAAIEAQEKNIANFMKKYTVVRQELMLGQHSYVSTYKTIGGLEGGTANIVYKSNWEDNIQKLSAANAGSAFKAIPTSNAIVHASIGTMKDAASATAVSAYILGAEVVKGQLKMPAYQPQLSAGLVLTTVGACPIEHPEMFDIVSPVGPGEMKYGLLVTYDIPSAFFARMKFSYNLYKMYERIMSSGSSGGLFSSRSWTSITESEIFRDNFSVDWQETDPDNKIDATKRQKMIEDVKANLIIRLATMTNPQALNNIAMAAAQPPVHGAVIIADGLAKCPNVYCQIGSYALRALDAIFGSSSSTQYYRKTIDQTVTEYWSFQEPRNVPWMTFYQAK